MSFSGKNTGARRIFKELAEIKNELEQSKDDPTGCFCSVECVNDNLFELHFTIRGPPGTPYELGCYHGKLILPHDYPFKPPEITFLTPSGRFEVKKKLCLSVSDFHPESWQPAWGLRTVLIGISSFMSIESAGSIGSIVYGEEDRKKMAQESLHWCCPDCSRMNVEILPGSGKKYETKPNDDAVKLSFAYQKQDESQGIPPPKDVTSAFKSTASTETLEPPSSSDDKLVLGEAKDLLPNNSIYISQPESSEDISTSSVSTVPSPTLPRSNAAALATILAQKLRSEADLLRQAQEARTLRTRIDFLIFVLVVALLLKLIT